VFKRIAVYEHESDGKVELLVKVEDNPIIYSVEFVGNEELSEEELRRVVGVPKNPQKFVESQLQGLSGPAVEEKIQLLKTLPVGKPLSPAEIEEMVRRLKMRYALAGYPNVKITYQIVPEKGASKLVFRIDEGSPRFVKRIEIEGLKEVDPDELKDLMTLKEPNIFAFRLHPAFSESALKEDLNKIVEYLKSIGYLESRLIEYKVIPVDKEWVVVRIKLYEGPRYKVGKVFVEGNTYFGDKELTKEFLERLEKEDYYFNARLVQFLKDYTLKKYRELGLYNTSVAVKPSVDRQRKVVDLTLQVNESKPVYNRWTSVKGNYETRDYVIRRELELHEGDLLTEERVKWSKIWLNRLGYFAAVGVRPEFLTPETAKVDVEVKERFTGQLSVGVGYGETTGLSGFFRIRKGNFLGTGDIVSLSAAWGEYARSYSFSYTRKWFLHQPQDLSFSLYSTYNDYDTYDIDRKGVSATLTRRFWHYWRWSVGTDFQKVDYSEVPDTASIYVKEMAQFNSATILRLSVERDTRNNFFFPTEGSYFGAFNRFGGIFGGDEKFEKFWIKSSYYKSDPYFMKGTVFSVRAQTGFVIPWGGKEVVPIDERFFIGGAYTVRGYKYGYAGPLDPNTGDPIGGKRMWVVNFEADYPVKENLFYLAAFTDFGNAADSWGDLFKDVKGGAGFGFRFITPMAPLKLDFAWKFKKVPGDTDNFRIHLTIGTFF